MAEKYITQSPGRGEASRRHIGGCENSAERYSGRAGDTRRRTGNSGNHTERNRGGTGRSQRRTESYENRREGYGEGMGRSRRRTGDYGKRIGRRRKRAAKRFFLCATAFVLGIWILGALKNASQSLMRSVNMVQFLKEIFLPHHSEFAGEGTSTQDSVREAAVEPKEYSEVLAELLEKNEETFDYVQDYPNRETYKSQPIDLTEDFVSGEVPLLMQWDRRWGYDAYGEELIGLAGCGPLCLEMAYLYFTEDTDMTPRKMADFAYENGFYTEQGTSWSLWTEGVAKLGLKGAELSLDENVMKQALDAGNLIVCSMRPGDFTTTGHFILIRGYDEEGFQVNDPNRRSTSGKTWDYETLRYQIRNLWSLGE